MIMFSLVSYKILIDLLDFHQQLVTFSSVFIHSFIHAEHLYSASSRELLRGAQS